MWVAADNGSGVTVSQAHSYCRKLTLGGFRNWRLPEIDEVQTLFGGERDDRGYRIVAPLKLTGWAWSATTGNEPAAGDAGLNRALCVRSVR